MKNQHKQSRHGQPDIGDAADHGVGNAPIIGGDKGEHRAQSDADKPGDKADPQCQRRTDHHHRQKVAALSVGAEWVVL